MEVVRSLGLEADEIVDLQDSNRLTVRVLPCDLVARIGPADHAGAQVEVDRVLRLAEAEAPVGRLDPRTPPQVHVRDGFEITLWTHYAPHEDRALPAAEYASTLARLHAAMRAADLDVPPVGDRVAEALALVDDPVCTPRLPEADRAFLREILQSLSEEVSRRGPQQVLHGEPHPGNVLDTAGGPLFIDLETCCSAPVEFDLAHAPGQVAAHYPNVDHEPARGLPDPVPRPGDDLALGPRGLPPPDGQLLGVGWLDQGAHAHGPPAPPGRRGSAPTTGWPGWAARSGTRACASASNSCSGRSARSCSKRMWTWSSNGEPGGARSATACARAPERSVSRRAARPGRRRRRAVAADQRSRGGGPADHPGAPRRLQNGVRGSDGRRGPCALLDAPRSSMQLSPLGR